MTKQRRKFLWLIFVASLLVGMVWDLIPVQRDENRLQILLDDNQSLPMIELPLADRDFLGEHIIQRLCQAGNQLFVLTVVDGAKDRHALHEPMYCFRGAGWEVQTQSTFPLADGSEKLVSLQRDTQQLEILYWFSDGKERHASAINTWLNSILHRASFGHIKDPQVLVIIQPWNTQTLDWKLLFVRSPILFEF